MKIYRVYWCHYLYTKIYSYTYLGFEFLTAARTNMAVFWVVAPCSLVEATQRFRGPCCLHHQGDSPWRQLYSYLYVFILSHADCVVMNPFEGLTLKEDISSRRQPRHRSSGSGASWRPTRREGGAPEHLAATCTMPERYWTWKWLHKTDGFKKYEEERFIS
jgi:hypothetical protein